MVIPKRQSEAKQNGKDWKNPREEIKIHSCSIGETKFLCH